MPIEQAKTKGPVLAGVNSIVVSPVVGRSFSIFRVGIVKAREQDWTLLVMSFNLVGMPFLRVMFAGV